MIQHIKPVSEAAAEGMVKTVYAQIKEDFGMLVEPFTLHSPSPKLLAGIWMATRESLVAGDVRRELKEAIAATVSRINQCPYCVDAHTIMLHATSEHKTAKAISKQDDEKIQDSEIRSIVEWASANRSPGTEILRSPPFSRQEAPEIIGTAVVFHYINRMVSLLLNETPLPSNNFLLKGILKRVAGRMFSRAVHRTKPSGLSLNFLPAAELPKDFAWAESSPIVAKAFSRWAAVVEDAGKKALSSEVRAFVLRYLQSWKGEAPGLDRSWVEHEINEYDNKFQAEVRLTLLTAIAPYQADEMVIQRFRNYYPQDEELISALAWSSFIAARRIGTWLYTY
ncbi:MAG: carboxymuconolactone decarboxylase family protein [Promethearchaeota archaeon]